MNVRSRPRVVAQRVALTRHASEASWFFFTAMAGTEALERSGRLEANLEGLLPYNNWNETEILVEVQA